MRTHYKKQAMLRVRSQKHYNVVSIKNKVLNKYLLFEETTYGDERHDLDKPAS